MGLFNSKSAGNDHHLGRTVSPRLVGRPVQCSEATRVAGVDLGDAECGFCADGKWGFFMGVSWEFHGILIQDFMGVTGKDYNIREIHFTPSFGKKGI